MHPNYTINVLSRRPEIWNQEILGKTEGSCWEHMGEIKGRINKVSADPAEVLPGSHVIIICSPAHTKLAILE